MKKILALVFAAALAGCAADQPLEDTPKPGVEDRSATAKPPTGPTTKPVTPGTDLTVKPVTPDSGATSKIDPALTDPKSILSKRSIFYDYDSDAIKEEYRPLLQAHAAYLQKNPNAKMLIQGNTDERGSREYNIALGQRRSDAAKRMLVLLGAREQQIDSVSLGEEKPRCTDTGEACLSQNRRSDMLYGGEF
jgi:peptidoglycan-associated lipoprotein